MLYLASGYIDCTIPYALADKLCNTVQNRDIYTVYYTVSHCSKLCVVALTGSTMVDTIAINDDSPVATASHWFLIVCFVYIFFFLFFSYRQNSKVLLAKLQFMVLQKWLPSVMTAPLLLLPIDNYFFIVCFVWIFVLVFFSYRPNKKYPNKANQK